MEGGTFEGTAEALTMNMVPTPAQQALTTCMPAGAKTVKGMVSTGADPHMPAGAKTVKGMVSTGTDSL